MRLRSKMLFTSAAMTLVLAGCEMDPALMGTMPVAQPVTAAALNDPSHYAAVQDNGLAVPGIPVDQVPAQYQRQLVNYDTDQPVGTIIIDPSAKHLFLITARNKALRYGIAVGREGFGWSGEADITSRTTWPKWTPPYEMIDRSPELEKFRDVGQPGGLTNPLGARALYLKTNGVDYGYRIHGTPEWETIGRNASSGCIRMINQDVMDLYNRVPDGTRVVVLTEDGQFPTRLNVPPVTVVKKPKPVAPPAPPPPPVVDGGPIYGPI